MLEATRAIPSLWCRLFNLLNALVGHQRPQSNCHAKQSQQSNANWRVGAAKRRPAAILVAFARVGQIITKIQQAFPDTLVAGSR